MIPDEVIKKMAKGRFEKRFGLGWDNVGVKNAKLECKEIRAALKAAEAMGWVMVPIKPTEPMVLAAGPLLVTATKGQEWAGAEYTCSADIGGMYSAMISAAPKIGD